MVHTGRGRKRDETRWRCGDRDRRRVWTRRATAETLAARGAKVAVFDLNPTAADAAAKAIGGLALAGDVADEASAGAAIAKAAAVHGAARVLINCAGIGTPKRVVGREGPQPLADFEKVIRVNLIGTFNMIRLAAAEMAKLEPIDGERGVVISTASIAAFDGQIGQAAYSASKGGVVAMTLPIARELAQFAVRVNAIAPGVFMTPMMAGLPQPAQDSLGASVPFPPASASRPNMPRSPSTSSRTATSTARRSASTARSAWRRNSRTGTGTPWPNTT